MASGRYVFETEKSHNSGGRTRCPSMLMKYDEVCDVVGTTSLGKVLYHVVASVDPVRIRENQAHLLQSECEQKLHKKHVASRLPWQTATALSSGPSTSSG